MRALFSGCLIALVCALLPATSSAQLSIESGHDRTTRVRGDTRNYVRVSATRPLGFEVTGPGQLTIVLRQDLESDQPIRRTSTRVSLLAGPRVQESFNLTGSALGQYEGRARASRPTEALEHGLDIPAGAHSYTLRVDTSGHQIVVALHFIADSSDDLVLVPLVPLAGPSDDESDDLPLLSLAPLTGDDDDDGDDDLPLLALVPIGGTDDDSDTPDDPGDTAGLDTGRDVNVAMVTDGSEGPETSGAVIGRPIRESRPKAPRNVRMILGVRGLAAATGMGGNTVGGGVDLLLDNGLLDRRLTFGLSGDFVSYSLIISRYQLDGSVARSNFGVDAIPVMAVASYILPFQAGPLKWQVTAGVGPVLASVSDDMRSTNTILIGGVLAAGPRLDLGPGALMLAVRASGGYGSISDHRDRLIMRGPLGGLGLTAGYLLSI